ncbi:MAG TPA: GNAT family N-acetyltransferase [Acetobacteraceae bacterium]|nr:GNAT family N-acetyltransferase [Acetobacteraceae bacterium]
MSGTERRGFALTVTDAPGAEAEAMIEGGLHDFNRLKAGYVDSRPLAVLVRDTATSKVVGGVLGKTTLGLLFIDLVFLPDATRGKGVGGAMMRLAEEEARRRGCSAAVLFTIWFQAPEFYARLGYQEVGRIACDPPGHTRICMQKRLVAEATP